MEQAEPEALLGYLNQMGLQQSLQYATLRDCCNRFREIGDKLRAPHLTDADEPAMLFVFAIRFVVAYLRATEGELVYKERQFNEIFSALIEEFDATGWRWLRRTPLHNFVVPQNAPQRFECGPGIVIRPILATERDAWQNYPVQEQLKWQSLANVSHLIEIAYERPMHDVQNLTPAVTEADLLFALRMSGSDSVSYSITEQKINSIWTVSIHFAHLSLPPRLTEEKYVFDLPQQTAFARSLAALKVLEPEGAFQFAKRRYGDALARQLDEDRVVDYWVGAEALFSGRREANNDLRERLAARLSAYVSADDQDRALVFAEAYASYRDRSDVVHGRLRRTITSDDVLLIQPHIKTALRNILADQRLPDLASLDVR